MIGRMTCSDTGASTEMSTELNLIPAQELKRRGTAGIEERLRRGPVHVLRRNRSVFKPAQLSSTDLKDVPQWATVEFYC